MSEADRGAETGSQSPTPDASGTTDEENAHETRQQAALEELFLILEEVAGKESKPVNAVIRGVPMLITTDNDTALYILRINPAIVSNGKLNVAVLDLYRDETHHLQQWVIKAEWADEKPKITGLDGSMVEEDVRQFRLTEIAEYAGRMLRGGAGKIDSTSTQSNLTMRMPTEYSPRVN